MSRRSRVRGDAGAGTLEYVGGSAVAVALVLALLLVAAATGVDAAVAFRNAICNAINLPCGGTPDDDLADDRTPTDPCKVSTGTSAGEGSVDIAVVAVDGGAKLITTRLSDGTYQVTLVTEDGVGATTGVGGGFTLDTGSGQIGAAASASLSGGVVFGSGMTWTGLTAEQAESISNDLKPAVQAATTGFFRDLVRDAWEFVDGPDSLRQPDQVFVHGGLQGDAGAGVAYVEGGASAEATARAIIGTTHDRTENTYTVYVQAGLDASAQGGVVFGPQARAALGGNAMVEVTVGEDGKPRSLVLSGEATAGLFGQLGIADGGTDTIFDDLHEQYADPDNGVGGTKRTEARLALDLTNERNAQAAYAFLAAAGVSAVGNQPIVNPGTINAGADLAERFYETGTLSLVEYDVDGKSYGASGDVKFGLVAGLSTGMDFETAVATRAQYWDGEGLVDLPGCVA
jgi:hypothetical protein